MRDDSQPKCPDGSPVVMPPGTPPWIEKEDIADTLRVWQPYSRTKLTECDAVEIITNVTNLLRLMFVRQRNR